MLKHSAFKYLKYAVFLGISVLLLWLVYRKQDLSQIWHSLKQANYAWVGLSVAIILLSHVARAQRWRMLITPIGNKPRLSTTVGAVLIGYFANLGFPRLGEVTKCGIINRYERIPVDKLVGTMIMERALDLATLLLLTLFILVIEFERFGDFFATRVTGPIAEKLVANQWVLLIVAGVSVSLVLMSVFFFRRLMRLSFFMKARGFAKGMWEGIRGISKVSNPGLLIFHSLFIWTCYYFATWVCFFALPTTQALGASAAMAVLVFGSYGMTAPVQGGIGAFHLMAIATLQTFLIESDAAGDFAALIHGSQMLMVIVLGFLALIILPFLHRKQINARPPQTRSQSPS